MAKRNVFRHLITTVRYCIFEAPAAALSMVACYLTPSEIRNGIQVVDPQPKTRVDFTNAVDAALDLIAKCDRVRFRRVQSYIHIIFNSPVARPYTYGRWLGVCTLSLSSSLRAADESKLPIKSLAAVIIIEATCGYLMDKGIRRTRQNCSRFDRICCEEAHRFTSRLGERSTSLRASQ